MKQVASLSRLSIARWCQEETQCQRQTRVQPKQGKGQTRVSKSEKIAWRCRRDGTACFGERGVCLEIEPVKSWQQDNYIENKILVYLPFENPQKIIQMLKYFFDIFKG